MSTEIPSSGSDANPDEEVARKMQEAEGFDAVAVQAQRESDEEYARFVNPPLFPYPGVHSRDREYSISRV